MKQKGKADINFSWHGLEEWIGNRPDLTHDWELVRKLKETAEKALQPYKIHYQQLEEDWKLKMQPLCGDFDYVDWERFRPLRQSREEDWSDWLAWLLETSATGRLAEILLGGFMGCDASEFKLLDKKVEREQSTENRERRADIVAMWKSDLITHIEVKLGDQNFEKTFETCRLLREKLCRGAEWWNAILIPEMSRAAWKNVAEEHPTEVVEEIRWNDVTRALRRCLWEEQESVLWRAWAWSFSCAIENRILHLRTPDVSKSGLNGLAMAARWVEILAVDSTDVKIL